ncbi:hypothetical protein QJS10_CPB18g01424 [Acorus calamus]|uniref:NAC domain-containing protein n=1 Tax=Acorus calamus TaxID=4465 RepID=A0AAV9CM61_ACOCL|nr:hypothetical protein QJS10_CPB18g01424 [Acorus calamus]
MEQVGDMGLPPGFRFHPTDEELITHYLSKKVEDGHFETKAIGEVDLNKCEPWDLPWRAKMGSKEWYFFCMRDRKYPTGLRTNRATQAGYWKATGKDKKIYRAKALVGMKKTLVFYRGRAPKGEKTNWVMHEYRLEEKYSLHNLPKTAKNEWAICRVFQKSSAGKKTHLSGLMRMGSFGDQLGPSLLPPLTDPSKASASHVTYFSNAMESQRGHEQMAFNSFGSTPNTLYGFQEVSDMGGLQFQGGPNYARDQASLRALLENHGFDMKQGFKTEKEMGFSISQETGLTSDVNPEISSVVSNHHQELGLQMQDCLWSYTDLE